MEIYKRPSELKSGDLIEVSAQSLGKPGYGFFKVQVISVELLGPIGYAIYTAGGIVNVRRNQLFQIVEDDMHRDDLPPQFPRKQQRIGRSID